jgi:ribosomal protein L35AE/L33A
MENWKMGMPQGLSERRSRVSTLLAARCVTPDGRTAAVKVRNLSDTGLGGDCGESSQFLIGDRVFVSLRHVDNIPGHIVRITPGSISIRFTVTLDPQRLGLKGWWHGPDFEVEERHRTGQKCWRPGITIGRKSER